MLKIALLVAVSMVVTPTAGSKCTLPRSLGTIKHDLAAFLDVLPNGHGGNDLFISSFTGKPFTPGSVSRVQDIGNLLSDVENIQSEVVDPSVKWPNGIKLLPEDVYVEGAFSKQRVIGCGGFLVPTHGNGKCIVYDIDEYGNVKEFVLAQAGWFKFYHHAEFYDVDGDGYKDLISAKASKPLWGGYSGELYWYKNPGQKGSGSFRRGTWKEHLMMKGPDVTFKMVDLDHDGTPEIVATQFFSGKLTVNWLKDGCKFDGGPSSWEQRTVVNDLSFLFNMTFADLNGDGRDEIVLTNHVTDPELAGVYAVEIPDDFRTGKFKHHTLLNDFPTLNEGPGQASPGGAIPIYNDLWAVSGDGNQKAYIMCKAEGDEWTYQREMLVDTGNTVGAIAVADVTGDGNPEIFVPSYEKGEIHVYTYDEEY